MATLPNSSALRPAYDVAARTRFHVRPSLWVALLLSILFHLAWSLWPVEPPKSPDDVVLSATLTEMPAPPAPAPNAAAAKPHPKPKRVKPKPPPPAAAQPETTASLANEPIAEMAPDPALKSEKQLTQLT